MLLVFMLAVCCGAAQAADAPEMPNLVQNPGFEDVAADGFPRGWAGSRAVYGTVGAPVHTGKQALQFANANPDDYQLCSQSIPLEVGKAYEFSVWVKTENIRGDDSGATICLEWYSPQGYLGGSYPAGRKGTTDWKQVKAVSRRVPEGATRCNVTCYVRKGMTGKAWWDDVQVRQWREPPLRTFLLEPNYRGIVGPEVPRVELAVDLSLGDWGLQPEDVTLRTEIVRPSDAAVCLTRSWAVGAPAMRLGFALRPEEVPAGHYELKTTLLRGSDGASLATESARLEVPAVPLSRRVSYIDEHNRLIREGKPFFPLGMYWGSITEADLKLYADSAFNCLMPYGMPTREQMDLAERYGLKVIYSVKDAYAGSAWVPAAIKTPEDERPFVEGKVREFRQHPALLAWYLNDELPLEFMDRLEAHQQWLTELDPDHPTWVVLYQVGQLDRYLRTFDVLGTDPYPVPGDRVRRAADWTKQSVAAVRNRRPVWMVPQVFNWACYRKTDKEKEGLRPPTLDEMRSMAWQCIVHGARGLIFYSWSDIKRDAVVPFAVQWVRVKQMAAEIRDLIPIILSVEPAPQFRAPQAPWLHWTTRALNGDVYLIAVNDEAKTHRATFNLGAKTRWLAPQGEDRLHARQWLSCRFEPFEVKVYRMGF